MKKNVLLFFYLRVVFGICIVIICVDVDSLTGYAGLRRGEAGQGSGRLVCFCVGVRTCFCALILLLPCP